MLTYGNATAETCIGVSIDDVQAKKYNIWIGISLGNPMFTPSTIDALLCFALHYTHQKILIWIPGEMHATNYRNLIKMSPQSALEQALDDECKKRIEVEELLRALSPEEQSIVSIANYQDICTPRYLAIRALLEKEFAAQGTLHTAVTAIVREALVARKRTLHDKRIINLSAYVLDELPIFLEGFRTLNDESIFNVMLYPGLGTIDELVDRIKIGHEYAELREKLCLGAASGIIDISIHE